LTRAHPLPAIAHPMPTSRAFPKTRAAARCGSSERQFRPGPQTLAHDGFASTLFLPAQRRSGTPWWWRSADPKAARTHRQAVLAANRYPAMALGRRPGAQTGARVQRRRSARRADLTPRAPAPFDSHTGDVMPNSSRHGRPDGQLPGTLQRACREAQELYRSRLRNLTAASSRPGMPNPSGPASSR
jgi:hypothetical protein